MARRKSWADQIGLPTGVEGEVIDGIAICEANRATVFEHYREGIQLLQNWLYHYRHTGIEAVLFGIDEGGDSPIKYAVYVQPGFLVPVEAE